MEDLSKRFGGVRALEGVSFTVAEGALAGVIGPNGSGKTTAFNVITGVLKPSGGRIRFAGRDVTGAHPADNAALGMARTFQNIRLFRALPVIDNVMVGLHMRHGAGFLATVFNAPPALAGERAIRQKAMETLEVLGLGAHADAPVASLAHGDQRKVEFARALASEPKLLFLDEPTAGMNPYETEDLAGTIRRLHRELGLAIVLVEHDMKMVMGVCERIHVLNQGRMLAEGTAGEIQEHPDVIEAYLGRRHGSGDAAA